MKNLIPILTLALSLPLAPSFAQETVTSVNAVGMVKVTLARGQFTLIHNPFLNIDENITVSKIFDSLPNGSTIYFWDNQEYVTERKSRGAWSPDTFEISRLHAMFVFVPLNAPDESYEIVLSGEVPSELSAPEASLLLEAGFTLTSFQYPVEVQITNAGIPAQNGDTVYFWNGTSWDIERFSRGSWSPGTTLIKPGNGFYYLSNSDKDWTVTKPYLWP